MMRYLLAALLFAGCTASATPSREVVYPASYEVAWQEVVACWQMPDAERIKVVEFDCKHRSSDGTPCLYFDRDGWCVVGEYVADIDTIQVCRNPSRALLRHEMSHAVSFQKTGTLGKNDSGVCWL